jgi:hypothetical protein
LKYKTKKTEEIIATHEIKRSLINRTKVATKIAHTHHING